MATVPHRTPVIMDGRLVGRAHESQRLFDLLDKAANHGRALVVRGEAGIGKTALLEETSARGLASGFALLTATGVEFEADLTFSGLHQVLLPFKGLIAGLPTPERRGLEAALGQSNTGSSTNSLLVASATLAVLQQASADRPLLVIVDDFHWVDRASARILAMVARRLDEQTRVALLCAVRPGYNDILTSAGVPELELPPLNTAAASHLLDSRFPVLAPGIRRRLIAEAQGNPLALLQLPTALTPEQRTARAAMPSVLPLTARLQKAFASRYAELPDDTRRILLMAALVGSDRLEVLFGGRVTARNVRHLEPAQNNQLIRIDLHRRSLSFTHPLMRAAVVGSASAAQLRQAHLKLAKLFDDPDRRAWHLAAATIEPDESIAAMLQQTGYRSLHRGDPTNALNALLRAAELSPIGRARSRRLTEAAHIGAFITGDQATAADLLRDAQETDPEPAAALYAAATAAFMLVNGESAITTAQRILIEAIHSHAGDYQASDEALIAALYALHFVCFMGGRVEAWVPYTAAVDRLSPAPPKELQLLSTTFADPVHKGARALDTLDDAIGSLDNETEHWRIAQIASAAVFVDRLGDCRPALWRLVRAGRQGDAALVALTGFNLLARDLFLSGGWDRACVLASEGLELCALTEQSTLAFPLHEHLSMIAALRGDYLKALEKIDAVMRWATSRGALGLIHSADSIRTVVEMSRGNYETAYQTACLLSPAGSFTPYLPQGLYVCMDLVESATRIGKTVEAKAHVNAMQRAGIGELSSRLALLAGGAAALVAPDAFAPDLYQQALAPPESRRWPFDRARVQLNYGEHLRRRHGSTIEARNQLTEALDTFTRLGAKPWAERTAAELRAAGSRLTSAPAQQPATLTPQEYEIATLAASGLTNKEIAKRVFLSDRTVGAHLYRVFPKLGITKRAGLRDALNEQLAP